MKTRIPFSGLLFVLIVCLLLLPVTGYAAEPIHPMPSQQNPSPLFSRSLGTPLQGPSQVMPLRNANLLKNIGKLVTIEGHYYDGSIPMIVDDMKRVQTDLPLPPETYVPLTSAQSLKWGDRVKITGILEKPAQAHPHLKNESAVIRVIDAAKTQILQQTTLPLHPRATVKFDPKKFKLIYEMLKQPYAVLIAGGYSPSSNHIRYWNDLSMMYSILLANGYPSSNIIVIYADGVAKDNSMPVHYAATKANISRVFTELSEKMSNQRTLYIMTNDHGTQLAAGQTGICLWNDTISDTEFAAEVNKVTNYKNMIIQMKQCYSGGFVAPLTKPGRIVMSSCTASQVSWAAPDLQHGEFTYWYMSALSGSIAADTNGDGKTSILEAYNLARANDRASETPQFEGNGASPFVTGVVSNTGEGSIAATTFLKN